MIVEDCNSNTIENVMRIMAAADDDNGIIEIMMRLMKLLCCGLEFACRSATRRTRVSTKYRYDR